MLLTEFVHAGPPTWAADVRQLFALLQEHGPERMAGALREGVERVARHPPRRDAADEAVAGGTRRPTHDSRGSVGHDAEALHMPTVRRLWSDPQVRAERIGYATRTTCRRWWGEEIAHRTQTRRRG